MVDLDTIKEFLERPGMIFIVISAAALLLSLAVGLSLKSFTIGFVGIIIAGVLNSFLPAPFGLIMEMVVLATTLYLVYLSELSK